MIYKVIILVALTQFLIMTNKPLLCSGLYAGIIAVVGLLTQNPVATIAMVTVINFVVTFIYFWLLNRFHSGIIWWLIMIPGLAICLIA